MTETTDSYCDVTNPLYFESVEVIEYLSEMDEAFLREVIIHNETWKILCGS